MVYQYKYQNLISESKYELIRHAALFLMKRIW